MKVSKSFSRKTFRKVGIVLSIFYLPYLREYLRLLPANVRLHLIDIGLIGLG